MAPEFLIEIWFDPTFGPHPVVNGPGWRWRLHAGDGCGRPTGDVLIPEQPIRGTEELLQGLVEATGPHPLTDVARLPAFDTPRPRDFPQARSWDADCVLVGHFGSWRLIDRPDGAFSESPPESRYKPSLTADPPRVPGPDLVQHAHGECNRFAQG